MKTTITIDMNEYLSETDKKEIAINLFKEELRKSFLKEQKHKRIENYERVINNAVFHFLHKEIDNFLGVDHKEIIKKGVKKVLTKDLTYSVFRNASLWGDKKSVAQEMMDEIVRENRYLAEKRIKKALENLDVDTNMQEWATEVLMEILKEKLTN